MLNNILPALFRRLRLRSGLSRKQFAANVGISLNTLTNYERANTRPDLDTLSKIVEVSQCSDLELGEILCELLSDQLGVRVAILDGEHDYRPTTPLARARRIRGHYDDELSVAQRRGLDDKVHAARLSRLLYEWHNSDLDAYATDCRTEAEQRRKSNTDLLAVGPSTQGATGPATEGASRRAEPAFDNAAGTPSPHGGAVVERRQYVRGN